MCFYSIGSPTIVMSNVPVLLYIFTSKIALHQKANLTVRRILEKWTLHYQTGTLILALKFIVFMFRNPSCL